MTTKVWVYLAVTVISIGAGIAVAGIPRGRSVELSDVVVAPTTGATTTTVVEAPTTDPPISAAPEPSAPDATTTVAPETIAAPPTTSDVATPSQTAIDRAELSVLVANGATVNGVAALTADLLSEAGYSNVRTDDGLETVEASTVFASPGLQAEAERLAVDIGIDPALVFPLSLAPEVVEEFDETLLVYLGTDYASLL